MTTPYIEEKVEEFKRLFPCTYDQMSEDITTTHELFLRKALQEVDRRAREEMNEAILVYLGRNFPPHTAQRLHKGIKEHLTNLTPNQ